MAMRWLVVVTACAVVAACTTPDVNEPAATSTVVSLSPQQLMSGDSPLVGVTAEGCGLVSSIGSGLGFPDHGLVLTTAHTVAGTSVIKIVDTAGGEQLARVVYFDPTRDIAVLSVNALLGAQLTIGNASVGDAATIMGWRRASPGEQRAFTPLAGSVSRRLLVTIEDIWVQGSYERNVIEVSADIVSGDSGAPVLTDDGTVIGMVYASSRERSVAFALDHTELTAALDAARSATGSDAPPVDIDTGRCA